MSPSHNSPRGLDQDGGRYIEVDAAIIELIDKELAFFVSFDFSATYLSYIRTKKPYVQIMSVGNLFVRRPRYFLASNSKNHNY